MRSEVQRHVFNPLFYFVWPCGLLRVRSWIAGTLGSWVRILRGMTFLQVLSCTGRGLARGWSPIKDSQFRKLILNWNRPDDQTRKKMNKLMEWHINCRASYEPITNVSTAVAYFRHYLGTAALAARARGSRGYKMSFPGEVTFRNEGGRRAERERNTNCDVALDNSSLHTSNSYIARFSSTFFALWQHRGLASRRLLHAWSNWILYTPTTRASVQQVTEADWLTRGRDSRCAEASKTQPPSFVSVSIAWAFAGVYLAPAAY
jgi:hypothetical protein